MRRKCAYNALDNENKLFNMYPRDMKIVTLIILTVVHLLDLERVNRNCLRCNLGSLYAGVKWGDRKRR